MTIKFERFADNHMCKDYYYKIYDDEYHGSIGRKITISDYEFEKLFKDMAKELGYNISKPWDAKLSEKIVDKKTLSNKLVINEDNENNRKWTDQTQINMDVRKRLEIIEKEIIMDIPTRLDKLETSLNCTQTRCLDNHNPLSERLNKLENAVEMNKNNCVNHIHPQLGKGLEKLEEQKDIVNGKIVNNINRLDKLEDDLGNRGNSADTAFEWLEKQYHMTNSLQKQINDNVEQIRYQCNGISDLYEQIKMLNDRKNVIYEKLDERLNKLEDKINDYSSSDIVKGLKISVGNTDKLELEYKKTIQKLEERIIKLEEQKDIANGKTVNNINRLDKLEDRMDAQIDINKDILERLDKLEDKVTEPAWPLYVRKDEFDNIKYFLQDQIDGLGSKKISHIEHDEDFNKLKIDINYLTQELMQTQDRLRKLQEDIESNRDD